ncbi:MAG: hypothetical protein HYW26_05255 [Candidatus Aenigmarchaeota archaeon]|nr:hypothetical protein [Candidatus Aenigmarchaeota archaeon]
MAIEKGTIKVVWVTRNTRRIHSRMFEKVEEAEKFGKSKKDYLIFRLLWHKKFQTFSWEIMPYGNYRLYRAALGFYYKHKGKKEIIERIFRV